eukprot:scaffold18229_cov44-Prasinocladus_malaysianus.AAC.1
MRNIPDRPEYAEIFGIHACWVGSAGLSSRILHRPANSGRFYPPRVLLIDRPHYGGRDKEMFECLMLIDDESSTCLMKHPVPRPKDSRMACTRVRTY